MFAHVSCAESESFGCLGGAISPPQGFTHQINCGFLVVRIRAPSPVYGKCLASWKKMTATRNPGAATSTLFLLLFWAIFHVFLSATTPRNNTTRMCWVFSAQEARGAGDAFARC